MRGFLLLLVAALCVLLLLDSADARPANIYPPRRYARRNFLTRPVQLPAEQAPPLSTPAPEWHQVPADTVRARRWRAPEPGFSV
jgi:hypothetical protein